MRHVSAARSGLTERSVACRADCLHTQWRSAFSGFSSSTDPAQLRGGRRRQLLCTAAAGRPEAGPGALDKWSTDEDDAIDPGLWGDTKPATPLLDTIEYPVHLRHLKLPQLRQLCKEIREDLIHTVSKVSRLSEHVPRHLSWRQLLLNC